MPRRDLIRRGDAAPNRLGKTLGVVGFCGASAYVVGDVFGLRLLRAVGSLAMFYAGILFVPMILAGVYAAIVFAPVGVSWVWNRAGAWGRRR